MPRNSERSPELGKLGRLVKEDVSRKPAIKPTEKRIRQSQEYIRYLSK